MALRKNLPQSCLREKIGNDLLVRISASAQIRGAEALLRAINYDLLIIRNYSKLSI
jgi:hypothetical protein